MPRFSAFTPFGQLRFSSKPSHSQVIYKAMSEALGGEENFAKGGEQDSQNYAHAMVIGHVRHTLERAGAQFDPRHLSEMLATQEWQHGIIPPVGATTAERRAEVARRMRKSFGSRPGNISTQLSEALGHAFVAYRNTPVDEAVTSDLIDGVHYVRADKPWGIFQFFASCGTGTHVIDYLPLVGDTTLAPGQTILVQPDHNARREVVTVSDVAQGHFTATFTKPHEGGSLFTTGPFFDVWSSKRRHQLLLKAVSANDPEVRRKLHNIMRELSRAVTTWETFEESAPGIAGPFRVGGGANPGKIGRTPIGEVEF